MKKLLSCIAFVAMSLGFSTSVFADTLIASGGYGTTYFPSTCKWNYQTIATSGGPYTMATLVCSGVSVAASDYYNNQQGPAPVRAIGAGYYAVRKSGAPNPIGYDWAIYKKPVVSCSTPWRSDYIYNDLSSVSYARAMTMQFNPQRCSSANNCTLNIEANLTKYALVCK
jgi:hypothetical protein